MVGVREDEADEPLHCPTIAGHVQPVHADGAARRTGQAVEQAGECGLAGSVGADDRRARVIDGERDVT